MFQTIDAVENFFHHEREVIRIAEKSPCQKSKRGALIVERGKRVPLSHGFNHPPSPFVCQKYCGVSCNEDAIHAEMDALLRLQKVKEVAENKRLTVMHAKVKEGKLRPSGPPSCRNCSKHLLDAGMSGVWLYHLSGWKFYSMIEFHELSKQNDQKGKKVISLCP